MRTLVILLMILSLAYANSYGFSRITLERTWDVQSSKSFDLSAAIGVNNSEQRIISITTTPRMEIEQDENGSVRLYYQGNKSVLLNATAVIDVNYDTHIQNDSPVPGKPLQATPLTESDPAISMLAQNLSGNTSLTTIRNLVNWVHDNMEYDMSYWGKSKSARDVMAERRGVCVEYTHLLISLARSLGFETRYVSGYVMADTWQPHAWAEILVPGYGWLPADATFGQVGILDSTHVAVDKGADQSSVFDTFQSMDPDANVSAKDSLTPQFFSNDSKGVTLALGMDDTLVAESRIKNQRPEYIFGAYSFIVPEGYGTPVHTVVLLEPKEELTLYHGMNHSLFDSGFSYSIPLSSSFNDAHASKNFSYGAFAEPGSGSAQSPCSLSAILASLIFLAMIRVRL